MTTKITDLQLSKLVQSDENVRRTGRKTGIEELAASIQAHGLLQNLTVRKTEAKRGSYEVIAGGRRLAALKLLVKRKIVAADAPVPCHILDDETLTEISLAENALQCPMHPADQFEAFAKLHAEHGMAAEDIAARFGVTASVVRQRLKLAAVCPNLIKEYRAGNMNLDQLTAFAFTEDHGKQERVWTEQGPYCNRGDIIFALLEDQVAASDRTARFVGKDAYLAAGGSIIHDLFDAEHEGFFADADLLARLVTEKLQTIADGVKTEGWKWVTIMPRLDYTATADMRRVYPRHLQQEEDGDGDADEESGFLAERDESVVPEPDISAANMCAVLRGAAYDAADLAIAGAIVSIGHHGQPRIERGFIRPEDDPRPQGGGGSKPRSRDRNALSAALTSTLTAYRTVGLRDALGQNGAVALIAVTHALAAYTFYAFASVSCVSITARGPYLQSRAPEIDQSPAAQRVAARHTAWAQQIPNDPADLWAFVSALGEAERLSLLAYCVGYAVDASLHAAAAEGCCPADQLAQALNLDMTTCWQPTAASYFGRVSRDLILAAVREGVSPAAAENLARLKKAPLAEQAEQRLCGTGWLPAMLRTPAPPDGPARLLPEAA